MQKKSCTDYMYDTYARWQVGNRGAKLETGAKTKHGRPDHNTNARKLSERKGSGGTVQGDMRTGELATKRTAQVGKQKDARQ